MARKVGVLVHPTRLAVTGKPAGPSLYHLLEVLGREKVLERVDRAGGVWGCSGVLAAAGLPSGAERDGRARPPNQTTRYERALRRDELVSSATNYLLPSAFAQVSFRVTVRFQTCFSFVESGSSAK